MKIIPDIKKIAEHVDAMNRLAKKLATELDIDGLMWGSTRILNGCRERGGHLYQDDHRLDKDGLVDDLYYCAQYAGYCEDDFRGTLYFKTNVPGQFVAVDFEM